MIQDQSTPTLQRKLLSPIALILVLLALPIQANTTELVVEISGISQPYGQVACSLFSQPTGFPMDTKSAVQVWETASNARATCRFSAVSPGSYAISVGHDINNNKLVDTNFVGIPTEQWGVSNNVRPKLRAPQFDEAKFRVDGSSNPLIIRISISK